MSSERKSARSGVREGAGNSVPQHYPAHFYPMVGYQGPPQPWFPASGTPNPWSWNPPIGYPAPTPAWSTHQPASTMTTTNSTAAVPSDEYTVDTLRRIYNDDDGRVEIQRVKVQRRHPETGTITFPTGPEAMSVVPVGSFALNERRPPPRKNRRKQQMEVMAVTPGQPGPYPWYPYMPCVPYPYPYPYYMSGCMWPPGVPAASTTSWSGHEESERTSSRQDSLPTTLDSQRLESRISHPSRESISPVSHRSPSPAAASHLTDIHSIAPSDSVSVRGHKRETSLERALRGPTPPPRTKSRASSDSRASDIGKTQEWILGMHNVLGVPVDRISDVTDKSSFMTAPSDIVIYKKIPPKRKRRKVKIESISDKDSLADPKELDNTSDRQSVVSDMTFDESSRLSSELTYAFRKLEKSVDVFKTKLSVDSTPVHSSAPSPSIDIIHSSGDVTPTEEVMHVSPSDINILVEESDKQEANQHDTSASLERGFSPGSVCSLPALETAKADSTVDISALRALMETPVIKPSPLPPQNHQDPPVSQSSSITAFMPETGPPPSTSSINASTVPTATSTTEVTLAGSEPGSATVTLQTTTAPTDVTSNVARPSEVTLSPSSTTEVTIQSALKSEATTLQPVQVLLFTQPITVTSPLPSQPSAVSDSSSPPVAVAETALPAATAPAAKGETVSEGGRDSRASGSTFFSTRPSEDPVLVDTDSTDILLPTTDATTADEGEDHMDSTAVSPGLDDEGDYQWVLQQPGETPDLASTNPAREDERRNAWRAEVSLWRARLVVSLCRGRGLDRQDWSTFHLLVHHPLTLDLKLSLLHAPRLCAANTSTGAALVRVALIHLAQYGETLLQPEGSRQHGWRSVKVDPNQPWASVKGAVEVLRALGYQEREDGGVLRYPRRSGIEVSVLARLTLDMLVLAEELRLYLTGTHQYPVNIAELFFPASSSTAPFVDIPVRPPSSEGSFVSAHSETSLHLRPSSRTSSVTDDDTETLQASVRLIKNHTKKIRRSSTSEEEVTLKDDVENKIQIKVQTSETTTSVQEHSREVPPVIAETSSGSTEPQNLGSTVSLPVAQDYRLSTSTNMSSLPDLQSIHSSSTSQKSPRQSSSATSGSTETVITPVPTPVPVPEATTDNPEEHIYEEIDVIRAQVQALRASSVPVETPPPPLPPKKKVSSGGEDDSGLSLTYPQVEWSSSSMPGSLRGGSTGARRKKRRAPMPPEFMPTDWKNYQNKSPDSPEQETEAQEAKERKNKAEYRKSLNPFYEDIESVKENAKERNNTLNKETEISSLSKDVESNPFIVDKVSVAGFVGKNPFYEDVELLKDTNEFKESLPFPNLDGAMCAMGSLSELQDNSTVTRPKRRAPKPPPTLHTDTHSSTTESSTHSQPTKLVPPKRPPTPIFLKQTLPTIGTQDTENKKVIASENIQQIPSEADMTEKPHNSSTQAVEASTEVSVKVPPTVGDEEAISVPKKCEVITAVSANEASQHVSLGVVGKAKADSLTLPSEQSDFDKVTKQTSEQSSEQHVENHPVHHVNKCAEERSSDSILRDSSNPHVSKDDLQANKTEEAVPSVTKATHQRVSLQHPKTPPPPPPPPPPKVAGFGVSTETPKEPTTDRSSPPPLLPPKVSLSLLDDIPYMDAGEVKYAKTKHTPTTPQSPQYEIPEAPTLSPATMRQSLLLRGACNVPFIDESDLPPDSPPPPPPCPPPESPPETPHTSPPETPHTSPPETPHTSPPHTPHTSQRSSPITIKPSTVITQSVHTADARKIDNSIEDTTDKAPPMPPKTSQLAPSAPTKDPHSASPVTQLPASTQPVAVQFPPSISPEISQSPPLLPPKTTVQATLLAPSETSASVTHELASKKHSIQRSTSDDRYEIPDTSRAPPTRPPPPTAQSTKVPKPYTAASEVDRYEVPEAPKENKVLKRAETEERYEIPEMVKETALPTGPNGMTFAPAKPSCILL
ncbi:mucin-17 isoform X2 [Procambarus clarkii]|uniref:mucin-17 isoform X2 n=1 Tax=Procambarus clarkii TaxID=6728 RepID=UPI0037428CBC